MKKYKLIWILLAGLLILVILAFGSYSAWTAANPENTCARCHEINPSHKTWQTSSHREITCSECHGTAFSNGIHSAVEKLSMIQGHLSGKMERQEIFLTEDQLIETMQRCQECHQEEYKSWMSGGHSVTYSHIFLDEKHNTMERLYWDCFRCHGMHYEGTIYDLVEPVSGSGPWKLLEPSKADQPVITCMACHKVHTENDIQTSPEDFSDPKAIFYNKKEGMQDRKPVAGLYIRADRNFLRADFLPEPDIFEGNRKIRLASNPLVRICIQCHAPGHMHLAGTEDDRTPTGVHEGLACMACHETHSNDAHNSCLQCHPVISNCKLDHMKMNTTYLDPESEHNIHDVKCVDCHDPVPGKDPGFGKRSSN